MIMKETEKKKYLPKQVVDIVQNAGYGKVKMLKLHQKGTVQWWQVKSGIGIKNGWMMF
jgi:hypothetical protein